MLTTSETHTHTHLTTLLDRHLTSLSSLPPTLPYHINPHNPPTILLTHLKHGKEHKNRTRTPRTQKRPIHDSPYVNTSLFPPIILIHKLVQSSQTPNL